MGIYIYIYIFTYVYLQGLGFGVEGSGFRVREIGTRILFSYSLLRTNKFRAFWE